MRPDKASEKLRTGFSLTAVAVTPAVLVYRHWWRQKANEQNRDRCAYLKLYSDIWSCCVIFCQQRGEKSRNTALLNYKWRMWTMDMYCDTQVCTQQIQYLRLFTVLSIYFRVVHQFAKSITAHLNITESVQRSNFSSSSSLCILCYSSFWELQPW